MQTLGTMVLNFKKYMSTYKWLAVKIKKSCSLSNGFIFQRHLPCKRPVKMVTIHPKG